MKSSKKGKSIWGEGDKLTQKTLQTLPLKGKWLNLAAGDGRYTLELLEKVDLLVAVDIDRAALRKLRSHIPTKQKKILKTKVVDITRKLPFKNDSFDGVICTGTLHLFPVSTLKKIFSEIDRVLLPSGQLIFDFATDIQRSYPKKKQQTKKLRSQYTLNSAKRLLNTLLKNYELKIYTSEFIDDVSDVLEFGFKTKGNFILVVGKKY